MEIRWWVVPNRVRGCLGVLLWLCSASLIACATTMPSTTPSVPITIPVTTPPLATSPTPSPVLTREVPTRTPLAMTSAITLTLWTTEELAPSTTPAGRVLKNQFDAFTAINPNIRIEVVLKKPYGKGGMLDFLLTTNAVVPSQLPDLVTLDVVEVPVAAQANLLQPLDVWLSSELRNDFFPFAFRAAHYQNRWVALPFVLDAQHLVYHRTVIKKSPATWDELLKQKSLLVLPLAGDEAFVLQYLALTAPGDGYVPMPTDAASIAQVLAFFKRARDLGVLSEAAINVKSSEDAWTLFASNQVAMAQVSAARYLAERDKMPSAAFALVPTREGKPATVASGWAFAVVTTDPLRQAAATRFVQWLVHGERLAPWLRATKRLPAMRTTMALVVEPPEYATFLRETLEHSAYWAAAMPRETKVATAWRAAIAAVWKGISTPEDAARSIVAATK